MRKTLDFFNPKVSARDSPARDRPFLVLPSPGKSFLFS
ncbi:hypothetical protein Goshw_022140 [Gossypium schwendimanii]|uniref:Uncharacterized protein n=1 Tax=Gossypium schwendimanii TaxID=34291 RepID=A0A7J9MWW1_GOSSC|nr:hypothetical protein [Gossypium schwendimanii]